MRPLTNSIVGLRSCTAIRQGHTVAIRLVSVAAAAGWLTVIGGCVTPPPPPPPEPEPAAPMVSADVLNALVQMDAVQMELQDLRNEIELQRRDLERLRERQRELYDDLDQRLRTRERASAMSSPPPFQTSPGTPPTYRAGTPGVGSATSSSTVTQPGASRTSPPEITIGATTPSIPPTSQPPAAPAPGSAQEAYDGAFDMLRQSRYEDAIVGFNDLLARYPDSELADDSQYWIAEAHYVTRDFDAALRGFRAVVSHYPASRRVPEALLKVGYIQYEAGALEEARTTLTDLINRYPDSRVAISAQTRLRKIEQEGLAPSTSTQ